MTQIEESYEHICRLFSSGFAQPLPKHELTYELIRSMYHEEDLSEIVVHVVVCL